MPHNTLSREQLEPLLMAGFSQKEIAEQLGVVKSDVRYWSDKFGLKKVNQRGAFTCACGEKDPTKFWVGKPSMCRRCHSRKTTERYRKYKQDCVAYKGNCCQTCGYSSITALMFHHVDPAIKDLDWKNLRSRRFDKVKEELDKTVLVCLNCHAEIHFGPEGNKIRLKFEEIVGKEVAELTYYHRDREFKNALQKGRRSEAMGSSSNGRTLACKQEMRVRFPQAPLKLPLPIMSKELFYCQCTLEKPVENGVSRTVSWIPQQYAQVGRVLKLRDEDGIWDDGWKVTGASSPQPASAVEGKAHNAHKIWEATSGPDPRGNK